MWLRRIIRTILEITIAIAIFIIIAQKTSLLTKIMNILAYSDIQIALAFDSQSPTVINTLAPNTPFTSLQNSTITTKSNSPVLGGESTTLTPYLSSSSTSYSDYTYVPLIDSMICTYQGGQLSEGMSITAYRSPVSDQDNICQAETRTCHDGKLNGSYRYSSCSYVNDGKRNGIDIIPGASDTSPQSIVAFRNNSQWGKLYNKEYTQPIITHNYTQLSTKEIHPHGMENTRFNSYRATTVDTLDQSITKDTSSYHASCRTSRGESVNHGDFIFAYDISTSDINQQCTVEKRVCLDGKLSGTFSHKSCDFGLQNNSASQSLYDDSDIISYQTHSNTGPSNRDRVNSLYNYVF